MSISIRKLIMKPGSPDLALQQATIPESVVARIAHVNRLSKDIFDIVQHNLDLTLTDTVRILSKKGIIKITGAAAGNAIFYLQNNEIIVDDTKFYVQLSVQSDSFIVAPLGRGLIGDTYMIEMIPAPDPGGIWPMFIVFYELIKID